MGWPRAKEQTAGERYCACGCGTVLPATTKYPAPKYVDRRHWEGSAARNYSTGNRNTFRSREAKNNLCACSKCVAHRAADRSELIARVAAEKGVGVATRPKKKREITPESLAEDAAIRREGWRKYRGQ